MTDSHEKKWACLLLASLLVLFVTGCESDSEQANQIPGVTPNEILIGSTSALSGHAGFLGTQYTHGALAWFQELNAGGGVHGRQIRLVSLDDQYDPPQTAANTAELINDHKVFMLFNFVGTPTSVKIIDRVDEAKIPAFGFLTGAEPLRTPFRPSVFHVRASYYTEAEKAVDYFVDQLGFSRVAVMYQDDAFGIAVLRGVELAMKRRNLEISATATYTRGQLDVEIAAASIRESGAEAVIMVGTYDPLALFMKRCHDANYQPYFHTVSFVGSEAFAKSILDQNIDPALFERIIVTQVVPSPYSEGLSTVDQYRALTEKYFPGEEPNYVALEGFINAKVLSMALEAAGRNLNQRKLTLMIERMDELDIGIDKPLSFGSLDHSGLDEVYYSRLGSDGIFRTFRPTGEEVN
jgi:ABC-type branched-subunit amino acid transport system substrate-binding protein